MLDLVIEFDICLVFCRFAADDGVDLAAAMDSLLFCVNGVIVFSATLIDGDA